MNRPSKRRGLNNETILKKRLIGPENSPRGSRSHKVECKVSLSFSAMHSQFTTFKVKMRQCIRQKLGFDNLRNKRRFLNRNEKN